MTSKIHGFETNDVDSITTEMHRYSFLANNESGLFCSIVFLLLILVKSKIYTSNHFYFFVLLEDDLVNTIDVHNEEESDEENEGLYKLKLSKSIEFSTWEIAESYLEDYAKQEGVCFHKQCCIANSTDNSIICHHTFECTQARKHEAKKVVLIKNRRNRDSEMIGCSWHINLSFPKTALGVKINSIIDEHKHPMNPLITEIAPKFHCLTDEILKKIEFWTIHGRLGIAIQYNLLTALFSHRKVNKKDLSNAI